MSYSICTVANAPIRNSSTQSSEMLSQLLFGEVVEILTTKGKSWVKVRTCDDNFVGWVDASQVHGIEEDLLEAYLHDFAFVLDFFQPIHAGNSFIPLTIGSRLPRFDGMQFSINGQKLTFSGRAVFPKDIQNDSEMLVKLAKKYINTPYLWGGRSAMGIDGDGFVQIVTRMLNIKMPREADAQINLGQNVAFVEQAEPGDIAFFENKRGRIIHSGFVLEDQKIIHAYGKVRIDKLDHYGIFNESANRYTHRLRIIKRVLAPSEKKIVHEPPISKKELNQMQLNLK
ncbi:MAG TPA: hypothetical protein ENK75_06045 [Saprospiraceae bacterium]|nr:hypothetical protein [Saprospiraceae bacterium]